MTKPGHKEPLFDNRNSADLTPHAEEAQLRIGQGVPEPEIAEPEVPVGLRLTDEEETRVNKLMETQGLDRGTAISYTVSREKAAHIIGHHHATSLVAGLDAGIKEREAQKAGVGPTDSELSELLRGEGPKGADTSPPAPTNEVA